MVIDETMGQPQEEPVEEETEEAEESEKIG